MRTRLAALSLAALSLLVLAGCAAPAAAPADVANTPDASGCSYVESGRAAAGNITAPPADPTGAESVTLQTSAGEIPLTLTPERTPCTVGSFVSLAEQGYFDESQCHRLTTMDIYVLQCGDPSGTGTGGPGYSFDDEVDGSEEYPAGTVAMANAGPDTNGSQFFLVYEDTQLPPSYTVFGQMDAAGVEVVRQIAAVGAEGGSADGAPATPVTITGVAID